MCILMVIQVIPVNTLPKTSLYLRTPVSASSTNTIPTEKITSSCANFSGMLKRARRANTSALISSGVRSFHESTGTLALTVVAPDPKSLLKAT